MNFNLSQIPERTPKPRNNGLTMVMDKGLSISEVRNFLEVASPHVDIVKLGFGTSFVTPNLREKIEVYKQAGMAIYFGGTLFEAFLIRNQFEDYLFANTKLETASSTRHDFGKIYEEGENYYFKLNLQIRFK